MAAVPLDLTKDPFERSQEVSEPASRIKAFYVIEVLAQQTDPLEHRHFIERQMKTAPTACVLDYTLDDLEREFGSET